MTYYFGEHFNLSPVGGDANRGGAPWAVSHRPQSVWPCDKLKCAQPESPGLNKQCESNTQQRGNSFEL